MRPCDPCSHCSRPVASLGMCSIHYGIYVRALNRAICTAGRAVTDRLRADRNWHYPRRIRAKHGTLSMYMYHRCRCEACRQAYSEYRSVRNMRAKAKLLPLESRASLTLDSVELMRAHVLPYRGAKEWT